MIKLDGVAERVKERATLTAPPISKIGTISKNKVLNASKKVKFSKNIFTIIPALPTPSNLDLLNERDRFH